MVYIKQQRSIHEYVAHPTERDGFLAIFRCQRYFPSTSKSREQRTLSLVSLEYLQSPTIKQENPKEIEARPEEE